jgi:hypothetical protein
MGIIFFSYWPGDRKINFMATLAITENTMNKGRTKCV